MRVKNVKFLSTERYFPNGTSQGNYANFNLATHVSDDFQIVERNRTLLYKHHHLPNQPKWLTQVHSNTCLDDANTQCVADAIVTRQKGMVCAVLTADCLPIFASNQTGTQVGVAHAGWRGIIAGVIESFIAKFDDRNLQIHFGPAISQVAFEVGTEVYQQFIKKDKKLAQAFISKGKKYQLDLYQAATLILNDLGIKSITGGLECTYTQKNHYFSYRRDGINSGRMAHLIWIQ